MSLSLLFPDGQIREVQGVDQPSRLNTRPPNPWQTWPELVDQLQQDLDIHGVAYLWKIPLDADPTDPGPVIELRRLDPTKAVLWRERGCEQALTTTENQPPGRALRIPLKEITIFRSEQSRGEKIMAALATEEGFSYLELEFQKETGHTALIPCPKASYMVYCLAYVQWLEAKVRLRDGQPLISPAPKMSPSEKMHYRDSLRGTGFSSLCRLDGANEGITNVKEHVTCKYCLKILEHDPQIGTTQVALEPDRVCPSCHHNIALDWDGDHCPLCDVPFKVQTESKKEETWRDRMIRNPLL